MARRKPRSSSWPTPATAARIPATVGRFQKRTPIRGPYTATLNDYVRRELEFESDDLATPYFATEYTFNPLGLEPHLRDPVRMGFYEAGHMMYIHMPSWVQLRRDLIDFIVWALPAAEE